MTATAEAPPESQVIPLDMLSQRIERAVNRLQPPDKRPRLLRRLRHGPEYPLDTRAAELTRGDAIAFCRQVMSSLEPDEYCEVPRSEAATCEPDTCVPCKAHAHARAILLDLIAHELDEMEAQLIAESAGEVYEEICHPAEGAWWAYCSHCGTRFQTARSQTQFCGATCRKAAQRARDRAAGLVRP
jgi:hypothetical protein